MEAIVSPTIVTVTVFVAYVAETMNARFCTLDSVHLICTPRERSKSYLFVLEVSVTVKVAFPVRVGVQGTRVQNEEPPPPPVQVMVVSPVVSLYATEIFAPAIIFVPIISSTDS